MTHDEYRELLGAFALDALDPDEAAAVQAHLATCAHCSAEVAQHHEVAGLLANTGGDAPADLWDRIAEQIEHSGPRERSISSPLFTTPGASRATAAASRTDAAPAPQTTSRLGTRGRRFWAVASSGAAALLVVIALLGIQVGRLNHRVDQLDAIGVQQGLSQAVHAALLDPQAQHVQLRSATAGSTVADIVVLPSGAAYVANSTLPELPTDQTYQLWGEVGGQLISLGLLGNAPTDVPFTVSPSAKVTAFAVTAEQAGGVVHTTHQPVAISPTLST